jgi:hypothetical protein
MGRGRSHVGAGYEDTPGWWRGLPQVQQSMKGIQLGSKSLSIAFDAVQSFETGTVVRRAVRPVVRPHNAPRCAPWPRPRYPAASSLVHPGGG